MPLLRRVIGEVLRRVRLGQRRTLRDVASVAGVSLPYLSEVERGTKEASSEVLAAICRALGLAMPDLLEQVRQELLRQSVPASAPIVHRPAPATGLLTHRAVRRDRGPRCAAGRWMRCAATTRPVAAVARW